MIQIAKPYLPCREQLNLYLDRIYQSNVLTNGGALVNELEQRLAERFGVGPECFILVANGSLALHLAFKALDLKGEVITSPFSFIATSSTLKWEGLTPIFSDIDRASWNLDPELIADRITAATSAIVPVHVFGNACKVGDIKAIADRANIKTVYDASHCFDVSYNGESLLKCGDVSTISFHATKVFHTVEGGAVIAMDKSVAQKVRKIRNFGFDGPGRFAGVGTNAKMSEVHAAFGLAVLDDIDHINEDRARIWSVYENALGSAVQLQERNIDSNNNHAYFPIVLESESEVIRVMSKLEESGIFVRRYFYPSLNEVDFLSSQFQKCVISSEISKRIVCLPIWPSLDAEYVASAVSNALVNVS